MTNSSGMISVALLTHNGGVLLQRLLAAVKAQLINRPVEIVAVDSGSTDGTLQILQAHGVRVSRISARAFNFGLTRDRVFSMAEGDIVVSLSQDAIPAHERWLENLIAPLSDTRTAACSGRSIHDPKRDFPQFYWERSGRFYFTREMKKFRKMHGRGLSNANSAIKREVWEHLKFGEQPIGEDFLFQAKLLVAGMKVAFPEGAEVLHHHDYNLNQLYKRCRNEGLGLRRLDFSYTETDLVLDLLSPRGCLAWARGLVKGQLRTPAALLFPWVRPVAVYAGSRFGHDYHP